MRPRPESGESQDLRGWFVPPESAEPSEAEAARRLLKMAESDWADLDRFAEALRRPECRLDYSYDSYGWPNESQAFREVTYYLPSAFRERAFLRAKAGEGSACAADLQSLIDTADRLHGIPSLMSQVIRLGVLAVRHGVVWEALRLQILGEEEVLEMDRAIATLDLCAGLAGSLQAERAILVRMIERGKNRRGELVDEFGLEIDPSDDWDENLSRAWEQLEVRFAPTGWFDLQKVESTRDSNRWITLLTEGDRVAIRRERAREGEDDFEDPRGLERFQGWGPAVDMALGRTLRVETTLAIERVAIAAERYRLRHGSYPADGAALLPDFLAEWPLDARSGEPLVYTRKADGTPWIRGTVTVSRGRRGAQVDAWQYTPGPP